MSKKLFYSTVFHDARHRMGISLNEYCLTDYIFKWQSNPIAPRLGWCSKTRQEMADFIGISVRGIQKMLERLDEMNLVVIDPVSREVKATRAWFDAVVAENEKLERPMKLGKAPEETMPDLGEQSSPHKNGVEDEQSSGDGVNKVHGKDEQSSGDGVNKVPNTNKEGSKETPKRTNKKKVVAQTPPVIHLMVEAFEKKHKCHFSPDGIWAGFSWSDKEFGGLSALKKKLAKRFEEKMGHIPSDDEIVASFSMFMDKAVEADEWFLKVFTPAGLNGQFQNAINRIHNGKSNGHNGHHRKPNNSTTGVDSKDFFSGYGNPNS